MTEATGGHREPLPESRQQRRARERRERKCRPVRSVPGFCPGVGVEHADSVTECVAPRGEPSGCDGSGFHAVILSCSLLAVAGPVMGVVSRYRCRGCG